MLRKFRTLKRKVRFWWISRLARAHDEPVIFLGKEKSGTSAIAKLLGELTGKESIIDIPPIWGKPEIRIRNGEAKFEDFVQRNQYYFSKPIIKEPGLSFFFPVVKRVFPKARFVLIVRSPFDNIRSVCNRLDIPGDLRDLSIADYCQIPKEWHLVFDGVVNDCPSGNYICAQAHRWNIAADAYLKNPDDMLVVRYEDFVSDKLQFLECLARKLGWDPVCDISQRIDVSFQPPGKARTDLFSFFGETNYGTIESVCRSRMLLLGYPRQSWSKIKKV